MAVRSVSEIGQLLYLSVSVYSCVKYADMTNIFFLLDIQHFVITPTENKFQEYFHLRHHRLRKCTESHSGVVETQKMIISLFIR